MFFFCPRCGSIDVGLTKDPGRVGIREMYYQCNSCSLEQKQFPQASAKAIENFRKKLQNPKKKGNR